MKIGIIGGSGLDDPNLIVNKEEKIIETPYGNPSSSITCGKIKGKDVCILARHGKNHEIPPSQVNNRANILALKMLGCTHIIATTAVGSLKEEIGRGDFVVLNQFIDFTRHRHITFHQDFKDGPKHTPMADPFSEELRNALIKGCAEQKINHHPEGTVVTIEGPRFSTRAESNIFRMWGADVINMSVAPECSLANEAEIPYAAIAMSTDYDCWKIDEEPVSWDDILKIFGENSEKMKKLLINVIENMGSCEVSDEDREFIKSKIKTHPDWPKPGIMFRDINSLLRDKDGFRRTIEVLEKRYRNMDIDVIAGIESRGFILGSILAEKLNKPMVLIRKPGKLPSETISEEYELEYGKDKIEIQKDAIKEGQKVLIVDDLCATGGTCGAACSLIEKLGARVEECSFVIDLPELGGSSKLKEKWNVFSLVEFEGE